MQQHPKPTGLSRRTFLLTTGGAALGLCLSEWPAGAAERRIAPAGPASKYTPTVEAAFVRRKGPYGMSWPGAVYDGEAARKRYQQEMEKAAKEMGLAVTLRPEPIYSQAEADQWLAEAAAKKPDGLLVMLLDRQQHSWPTAARAIESGIPAVVFAPVGAAFTTNTAPLAAKEGGFICSTNDFGQAAFGLKMLRARAKMREMRFLVIRGAQRREVQVKHFGTQLRTLPAAEFVDEYNRTPVTDEIRGIASDYVQHARRVVGATRDDVVNGVKSYVVARTLLEREEADGITMDCLGALGKTKISLPCIAWSRMLDHGIPAACEADIGASLTHALVQLLFDRPGFQQDPVAETARECLIGAHCSCATRLNGFTRPAEPYTLSHHHGERDAVPRTVWRKGQRMTVAIIKPSGADDVPPELIFSSGTVVDNVSVPPSGGCVVSVMAKLDGVTDLLAYPGFHQLFFYGDYKKELREYCQLAGIRATVV